MVISRDLCGLFIVGPGGLGKTHSVMQAMKEAGIAPRILNTHATAAGLYQELYAARSEPVVLMEDLEQLYSSLPALSLLRSLLWGPRQADGRMVRVATWTTATGGGGKNASDDEASELPAAFEFTSGIVMTANRFPKSQIFESLRTRVPVIDFGDVGPKEVFTFMRGMVQGGFTLFDHTQSASVSLSPEECSNVVNYLEECEATDLRMLSHALSFFYRFREGDIWKTLVDTTLSRGHDHHKKHVPTKVDPALLPDARVVEELCRRRDLTAGERVRLYRETTGKSRSAFFRHQRLLKDAMASVPSKLTLETEHQ